MKLDKILNSGLGIVLVVLASLVAGRTVRLISRNLARMGGDIIPGGILVLALMKYRNRI